MTTLNLLAIVASFPLKLWQMTSATLTLALAVKLGNNTDTLSDFKCLIFLGILQALPKVRCGSVYTVDPAEVPETRSAALKLCWRWVSSTKYTATI